MTHLCVSKLTIICSDNALSPGRRQVIIWTNAGILLIGPLGTNFSEILVGIQTFSFKKMHLKMSSAKRSSILSRPQCVNSNVFLCHTFSVACMPVYYWCRNSLFKSQLWDISSLSSQSLIHYCNVHCRNTTCFNSMRPRGNGRHFLDDIFKSIFLNENIWI